MQILYFLASRQLSYPDYNGSRTQLLGIVHRVSKFTPITPILEELHWLPINIRINYKLLILVFRAIKTGTPGYINSMLQPNTTNRPLPYTIPIPTSGADVSNENIWRPEFSMCCTSALEFARLSRSV